MKLKLYRINYEYETMVVAESCQHAEEIAREYANAALGDALRAGDLVTIAEPSFQWTLLASNWTNDCIPWNAPNEKTVGEYLCI